MQVRQATPQGSLVTFNGYLAGTAASRRPIGVNITDGLTDVDGIIEVCTWGICDILFNAGTSTNVTGGDYFSINTYGQLAGVHATTVNVTNYANIVSMETVTLSSGLVRCFYK